MFDAKSFIRTVYLYLFALVGLFILIFGSIGLINLALRAWVFPLADDYSRPKPLMIDERTEKDLIEGLVVCKETCELTNKEQKALAGWLTDYEEWKQEEEDPKLESSRQRQRQLSQNLAMMIVGLPLYLYHWTIIKKDIRTKKS